MLILGADQAAALPSWREPDEVRRLATIAVGGRSGFKAPEAGYLSFDMPRIDVSSTLVRERAAAGKPIRYLVPDKVANFIGAQSLYGASIPA